VQGPAAGDLAQQPPHRTLHHRRRQGDGSLKADFTTQQAQRYDGQVEIRLDIYDENGTVVRTATARAARTRTVAEDITPNERDKVWYEMSDELAHAADQVLEQYINASFYPYKH
jgi:hypothetical protein